MSEVYSAYPLQWPTGWKRTESFRRSTAKFGRDRRQLSVMDGIQRVLSELERMRVARDDVVISTNVPTRLDGLPRSDQAAPSDPGAAVYWRKDKATRVMAADHYNRVADNLAAIAATLEALRAIERHGGAQILDRAFTGFTALPSPGGSKHWRDVLGVPSDVRTIDGVRNCYRMSAAAAHPDRAGGSHDRMAAINAAWEQAQRELST